MKNKFYEEGRIILQYLLGEKPSDDLIKKYCDVLKIRFNEPKVISFNIIFKNFPRLLSIIEPLSKPKSEILYTFKMRLNAASVIIDTSPEGARLFYNIDGENRFRLFLILFYKILLEIIIFPLRLLTLKRLIKYEKS